MQIICYFNVVSKIRNNLHDLSLQVAESIDNDNIFKKKKKAKKKCTNKWRFLILRMFTFHVYIGVISITIHTGNPYLMMVEYKI